MKHYIDIVLQELIFMKNILIVEGNLKEENQDFNKAGIKTHN